MNRILGATRFQIYTTSSEQSVQEILCWCQEQQVAEILDWNIPIPTPDIEFEGQLGAINDCMQRNRGSSRYVAVVDWDELLVPKNQSTWTELLDHLEKLEGQRAIEYRFPCLFFAKELPHSVDQFPGSALAEKYSSNTLLINTRAESAIPPPKRAKYIADPSLVHIGGIHFVWQNRSANSLLKTVTLTTELGAIYHYRVVGHLAGKSANWVKDNDMHRFKDKLLARLQAVWELFPPVPTDTKRTR